MVRSVGIKWTEHETRITLAVNDRFDIKQHAQMHEFLNIGPIHSHNMIRGETVDKCINIDIQFGEGGG